MDHTATIADYRTVKASLQPLADVVGKLAEHQIKLTKEIVAEIFPGVSFHSLPRHVQNVLRTDRIVVDGPDGVEMWEDGTCGDHDCVVDYFDLHTYVIEGKDEEFRHLTRSKFRALHSEMVSVQQAELVRKRDQLLREVEQVSSKIV